MDLTKEQVKSIRPVRDLVAVETFPPKEIVTPSGIIGVTKSKSTWEGDEIYEGKILVLSNEAKEKAPWLNTEDVVVFHKLHEDYIPTKGDSYVKLIPWSMILGRKLNGEKEFDVEQFQPFYERILVKVEEQPEETDSGIVLVGGSREGIFDKSTGSGEVVHLAEDVEQGLDKIKRGDRIRWNRFAGTKVEVAVSDGTLTTFRDYAIVPYYEVLAVLEPLDVDKKKK